MNNAYIKIDSKSIIAGLTAFIFITGQCLPAAYAGMLQTDPSQNIQNEIAPEEQPEQPETAVPSSVTVPDDSPLSLPKTASTNSGGESEPPVAVDDEYFYEIGPGSGSVLEMRVLENDLNPNGSPGDLIIASTSTQDDIVVSPDRKTITYEPPDGFTGDFTFQYVVQLPGQAPSNPATVTIHVRGPQNPLIDVIIKDMIDEETSGEPVYFNLKDYIENYDDLVQRGQVVHVDIADGTTTGGSNGAYIYTPNSPPAVGDKYVRIHTCGGVVIVCSQPSDGGQIRVRQQTQDFRMADIELSVKQGQTLVIDDILANLSPSASGFSVAPNTWGSGSQNHWAASLTADREFTFNAFEDAVPGEITPFLIFGIVDSNGNPVTVRRQDGSVFTPAIKITITERPREPIAKDDAVETDEETAVDIHVLNNDENRSQGELSISEFAQTPAEQGVVSISQDEKYFTFTPAENFFGTVQFQYTVRDGNGLTASAKVTVTVNNAEDSFDVDMETEVTTPEDTPVTIPGTVVNPDHTTIGWYVISHPVRGTLTEVTGNTTGDFSFEYTPEQNYVGEDSFTVRFWDHAEQSAVIEKTIRIHVTGTPDAPDAQDDGSETDPITVVEDIDQEIDVLNNDSDPDGGDLEVVGNSAPSHGKAVYSEGMRVFVYTPDPNYNGPDSFTYTIRDAGGLEDTATVYLNVEFVNDAPVGKEVTKSIDEDTVYLFHIRSAFTDADPDQPIDFSKVTFGSAQHGTLKRLNDTDFEYTPHKNYSSGEPEILTFEYCDIMGECATAKATITINPVNDAPESRDWQYTAQFLGVMLVVVDVLPQASDADGDTELTYSRVADAARGTVTVDSDGSFEYVSGEEEFSGTDEFTFQVCDNQGACSPEYKATIFLEDPEEPFAQDDEATVEQSSEAGVTIDVLENDSDPMGLELRIGEIRYSGMGQVIINDDQTIQYIPPTGFIGEETFEYEVCNLADLCATAEVRVTVTDRSDSPPTAEDFILTTKVNQEITFDLREHASDPDGDELIFDILNVLSGTVRAGNEPGVFIYTPPRDFDGHDQIFYRACDDKSRFDSRCGQGVIDVIVQPENRPPTTGDDIVLQTNEDVPVSGTATATDPDGDKLEYSIKKDGEHGKITGLDKDTGEFTYTPSPEYSGTDLVILQATDPQGASVSIPVFLTIHSVNDAPTASQDSTLTTMKNTPIDFTLETRMSDVDDPKESLQVSFTTELGGTVTKKEGAGQFVYTYTPPADLQSGSQDVIHFHVCDPQQSCSSPDGKIVVNLTQTSPTADNFEVTARAGHRAYLNLNDHARDADGDELTFSVHYKYAQESDIGSIGNDPDNGGWYYIPPVAGYLGDITLEYTACSSGEDCASAEILVHIEAQSITMIAHDDHYSTFARTSYSSIDEKVWLSPQENDETGIDAELYLLTIGGTSYNFQTNTTRGPGYFDTQYGRITISRNPFLDDANVPVIGYLPNTGVSGVTDVIEYEISNTRNRSDRGTIYIRINPKPAADPVPLEPVFADADTDLDVLFDPRNGLSASEFSQNLRVAFAVNSTKNEDFSDFMNVSDLIASGAASLQDGRLRVHFDLSNPEQRALFKNRRFIDGTNYINIRYQETGVSESGAPKPVKFAYTRVQKDLQPPVVSDFVINNEETVAHSKDIRASLRITDNKTTDIWDFKIAAALNSKSPDKFGEPVSVLDLARKGLASVDGDILHLHLDRANPDARAFLKNRALVEGTNYLNLIVQDSAGNPPVGSENPRFSYAPIRYEKPAVTAEIKSSEGFVPDPATVEVKLKSSLPEDTGDLLVRYAVDDSAPESFGEFVPLTESFLITLPVPDNGHHTVYFQVADAQNRIIAETTAGVTLDTLPPAVTHLPDSAVEASEGSAVIRFQTSESANVEIEYGTTSDYGQKTTLNSRYDLYHILELLGLDPGIKYFFRIRAKDRALNESVTQEYSFTA